MSKKDCLHNSVTETKRRAIAFVFFKLLLFSFILSGCGDRPETFEVQKDQQAGIKLVKVSPVTASSPRGSLEYVGVLLANQKVNVSSEIGGTIEGLFFEKGDIVKKGQLLAEVGTTTVGLEVRRAEAALKEAEAAMSEAESNYKRMKNLHEIAAVSDSEFDYAKKSADMAAANVEKTAAALDLAKDQLKKTKIQAQIDGIIATRDVEKSEVIQAGVSITNIVNLDRLKIRLSVNEKDIHILRELKEFTFSIEAITGKIFFCRLFFVSPTADPLTRSFPVEMHVTEPDPRMADGMTVKVILPLLNEKKTIKVPSAWLSEENGKIGLYVVNDGKAEFREVTLGRYYDQRVEVLLGLSDQQLVICNPAGLISGDLVKY